MQNPWSETLSAMASGHSVKNADLFIRQSIWGLNNSQQCFGCLKYPGKHQHNQVWRLCQRDRPKGLLPCPDNSMSLRAEVTVCPAPGCLLERPPVSAHFPTEKGLQEAQGRRHEKLEEWWLGTLTPRHPRCQHTQSQLQAAGWVRPKQCVKPGSTILSYFCLVKMPNLTETISSHLK